MENARYEELMRDQKSLLSEEEIKDGWHFCMAWDGLLIKEGDPEMKSCTCTRSES